MWWRLFSRGRKHEEVIEGSDDLHQANEKLKKAEEKLADTKAKAPEIAKAVASARRVHYKVDLFTKEISQSFGRLHRG